VKARVLLSTWLVVVLIAGGAVGVAAWRHHSSTSEKSNSAAALATARTSITTLLTYQGKDIAHELSAEEHLLTPEYAGTYRDMMLRQVAPTAQAANASVAASVVASGIVRASSQSVVTLLFVNVTTHTAKDPNPVTQGSRLRVTLDHSGKRWLVSNVEPL